jgi:hypothetical protein
MAFTQSFVVVPDFPVTFQPELSHTPDREPPASGHGILA